MGRLAWAYLQIRAEEQENTTSQASGINNTTITNPATVGGEPNREAGTIDYSAFVANVDSSSTVMSKNYVSTTSRSSTSVASAPTAKLTINGLTNTSVKVGDIINLAWRATNADSFYSVSSATGCLNVDMNKTTPPDTHITSSGSSSGLDTWASEIQGCTVAIMYTAKNSKTGETATSTITVKVN